MITISFTAEQIDYIWRVLQARPYSEVVLLCASIKAQVEKQHAPPSAGTGPAQ
jgi:hypothetical protein